MTRHCRLVHVGVPADEIRARAYWRDTVRTTWPEAPAPLATMLVNLLAAPRMTPDALLSLADALEELRREASVAGHLMQAGRLALLAELPRSLARTRAIQETTKR